MIFERSKEYLEIHLNNNKKKKKRRRCKGNLLK